MRYRAYYTLSFALVVAGCSRSESSSAGPGGSTATSEPRPKSTDAPLVLAKGLRFIKPESGEVSSIVRREQQKATADGRNLIVYVGAKWCEPCRRFHQAAKAGELDGEFPDLSILEFDLDEDRERIIAAGYSSKLIPLFVRPGADGRASEERFEGGVKGDNSVNYLVPRIRKLLEARSP